MSTSPGPALRVVITGGPCSGKSTLIQALAERGYTTVPEAAIEVIADLNEEMGLEQQKVWRHANRNAFQNMIMAKQIALEAEAAGSGPVFHDRGRLDGIAYCRVFETDPAAELLEACAELPYDRVFLLDTMTDFDLRKASGRTSDRARSIQLRDALRATYSERGLEPVFVPEIPVPERVELVLRALGIG